MAGKPQIPYGEFLIIIIGLIVTILLLVLISNLLSIGCGKFRPGLIVEAFDDDPSYSDKLEKRLNDLDSAIEKDSDLIDTHSNTMSDFSTNSCYITKQIDDSLQSNYVSSVPEAEYKLPPDVQKKRAAVRQENSTKYILNLKKDYIKGKRNVPMIECFDSDPNADDSSINDSLNSHIGETTNNLKALGEKLKDLRKTVSDKQLGMYYVSLAYNDKYIKQSVKVTNSLNEGFENQVLDFTNMPPGLGADISGSDLSGSELSDSANLAPITKIEKLEDKYKTISGQIGIIGIVLQVFKNTIDQQHQTLKASTAIVNDDKTQKDQMSSTYGKEQTKNKEQEKDKEQDKDKEKHKEKSS